MDEQRINVNCKLVFFKFTIYIFVFKLNFINENLDMRQAVFGSIDFMSKEIASI